MPDPERADLIYVELGKPFNVSPNLNAEGNESLDVVLVDTLHLKIEQIGNGRIEVVKVKDFFEDLILNGHKGKPRRTPASPVRVEYIIEDELMVPAVDTLPLSIFVKLDITDVGLARRLRCEFDYRNTRYVGVPTYETADYSLSDLDPENQIDFEEKGITGLHFYWWSDLKSDQNYEIFFPPEPLVFRNINFTIYDLSSSAI